jgi:sec-independent protein translocase protein TatA
VPGFIGPTEIIILLVVALLVFGPKRLPEMGRSIGKGMREFKNSVSGKDDDEVPAELTAGDETVIAKSDTSVAATTDPAVTPKSDATS